MPMLARQLVAAYGSFLFFHNPWANLLLVAATFLAPAEGLCGLAAGLASLAARRACSLPANTAGIDVVNGVLAGLFVGATFAVDARVLTLAVLCGALAAPVGRVCHDRLVLRAGLPMLSAPLMLIAPAALALGRALALPWAPLPLPTPVDLALAQALPLPARGFLAAMGNIYFAGSLGGGVLVLAAVLLASRGLAVLAVLAWATVATTLSFFGLPLAAPAMVSAGTAGILAAIMCGGVFARPGPRALAMGLAAAATAGLLSLALVNAFWYLALPPLSLPFLAITWLAMAAMGRWRGEPWATYWLAAPQVPERSHEARRQAEARGLNQGSIALRAPFLGAWEVYQGVDGPHTHQGAWRHALDFHRLIDGRAHGGDGSRLSDYHCFGATVCSPAHGWIADRRDDLPDNPPGEVDATHPWGNFVLINLYGGGFVLLAHLQQGSVTGTVGASVAPGEPLARCGNSGRSPQPHLHLHVQTAAPLGSPTRPFHLAFVRIESGDDRRLAFDAVPAVGERVAAARPEPALAEALRRSPGRHYAYTVAGGRKQGWSLAVELDLHGQTWLRAEESGAAVACTVSDVAAALHGRHGPADPVLDALTLATGLTPLADERAWWHDAPPLALLPAPAWLRAVNWLLPGAVTVDSRYELEWQGSALCWRQDGDHRVRLFGRPTWRCRTTAAIAGDDGIAAFALKIGGRTALGATLVSSGLKADQGIAGWHRPARLVA